MDKILTGMLNMPQEQVRALIPMLLYKNKESESEALRLQNALIWALDFCGEKADADKVREISGDEKNHDIIYSAMAISYDTIPAAKDDLQQALTQLGY